MNSHRIPVYLTEKMLLLEKFIVYCLLFCLPKNYTNQMKSNQSEIYLGHQSFLQRCISEKVMVSSFLANKVTTSPALGTSEISTECSHTAEAQLKIIR